MKYKFSSINLRWLIPFCVLGTLVVVGFVAEHQPWGRGWFHDFKGAIERKIKGNPYLHRDNYTLERQSLQNQIDQWYPQILERYPRLQLEYKHVPDDQNGFLKIIEWQEEVLLPAKEGGLKGYLMKLPPNFLERIDWDHFLKNPDEIEAFLAPNRSIIERAITIGLMPEQSVAGISPNRYMFRSSAFDSKILQHLRLQAIAEANRGDSEASLKTLNAIRGWANHYSHSETPSLGSESLVSGIQFSLQSTIHREILPRLSGQNINYDQWSKLTKAESDLQKK